MPGERDIDAFERRAADYERGWLGRFHRQLAERAAQVALSAHPVPGKILDIGCGSGYLLRVFASRCPESVELVGVDPAPSMVAAARASGQDPRVEVELGSAERLSYADETFDLVVATTSFDHWADQRLGIAEGARVLARGGTLVVADLFSPWLIPTLAGSRSQKARTKARASRLLREAGLRIGSWHDLYPLIKAVVAHK